MMFNILKLLEIFYISNMFEMSARRLCSFWLDRPPSREMFSAFAMQSLNSVATATFSVSSRHDDHDLSPKNLRPRAISGLGDSGLSFWLRGSK